LILALETATVACSVALVADDGAVLAESIDREGPAHTQRLLPGVHAVLRAAAVELDDVETIAVGLGPGSYTGMRIGIATARALAQAGDGVRLVGVPTLGALAWALAAGSRASAPVDRATVGHVVALVDGRRKEVFAACYALRAGLPAPVEEAPAVVRAADIAAYLSNWPDAIVGGDGASLYAESIPVGVRLDRDVVGPTATMVARAWLGGMPGRVEGLADVLPIYGRAPDAVRWTARG
jgi:tRNA threonylcarbamoyladenosine biosynthesis protein TsaB